MSQKNSRIDVIGGEKRELISIPEKTLERHIKTLKDDDL